MSHFFLVLKEKEKTLCFPLLIVFPVLILDHCTEGHGKAEILGKRNTKELTAMCDDDQSEII